ncbi:MAG: TVP38/TMEM64 family protein [Planctomycetota bacterium]
MKHLFHRRRIVFNVSWVLIMLAAGALFLRALPVDLAMAAVASQLKTSGGWGMLAFGAALVLSTIVLLPAWPLSVVAGAVFGLERGAVLVSISSTVAVAVTFLLARYLARPMVARQARKYRKFEAIDRAIGEEGWKMVALLRLSPVFPFGLQNYFYGLTPIRFWSCVFTSWMAMVPSTLMYVYLGYLGRSGLEAVVEPSPSMRIAQWALRIIGFVATLAVTLYGAYRARQIIQEKTPIEDGRRRGGGKWPSDRSAEVAGPDLWTPTWRSFLVLTAALLMMAAAIWSYIQKDWIRSLIERLG